MGGGRAGAGRAVRRRQRQPLGAPGVGEELGRLVRGSRRRARDLLDARVDGRAHAVDRLLALAVDPREALLGALDPGLDLIEQRLDELDVRGEARLARGGTALLGRERPRRSDLLPRGRAGLLAGAARSARRALVLAPRPWRGRGAVPA